MFLFVTYSTGQDELMAALQQLQDQLTNNGLAPLVESATNVQDLLSCAAVGQALLTRRAVLKQRKAGKPIRNDAKELAREVWLVICSVFSSVDNCGRDIIYFVSINFCRHS